MHNQENSILPMQVNDVGELYRSSTLRGYGTPTVHPVTADAVQRNRLILLPDRLIVVQESASCMQNIDRLRSVTLAISSMAV